VDVDFYINDKPIGAVVGQQPFGGARASGTNDEAAASDLLRWTSPRLIEETLARSLFGCCRRRGTIFRDPTSRIRVGRHPDPVPVPLQQRDVDQAVAAANTPEQRLVVALAAIHAARPQASRGLRLDDLDLGDRRLSIAGRTRPLDELTRCALLDWLAYRRARWPNTANPHLLVTQHTANETGPISRARFGEVFFGLTASLDRLRIDRQLEEALAHGADPLHLASVFGVSDKTAIRYATAARQLLVSPAEDDPKVFQVQPPSIDR
jgi:integrase